MKVLNFSDLPEHIQKMNADKLENATTSATIKNKGIAKAIHDKYTSENLEGLRNDLTVFRVNPVSKPRMTPRDKWLNPPRKVVSNYWSFKDELNRQAAKQGFVMPESNYHIIFYLPMPKSWSKKKRKAMLSQPHQQKPDKDNLEKAFLDALLDDDSKVWDGRVSKRWSEIGMIHIFTTS